MCTTLSFIHQHPPVLHFILAKPTHSHNSFQGSFEAADKEQLLLVVFYYVAHLSQGPNKLMFYLPDIDSWDTWLSEAGVDIRKVSVCCIQLMVLLCVAA
jgi:hypothetical protein